MASAASSGQPAKVRVGTLQRCNVSSAEDLPEQSWCNTAGESFETRVGPGYAQNRRKEPSKPCLYECVAVDLFTTDTKIRSDTTGARSSVIAAAIHTSNSRLPLRDVYTAMWVV